MAKKKSTKATKSPGKSAAAKPASKTEDAPRAVTRSLQPEAAPARALGAMSTIEIGHVAGDVWGVLSRDGGTTLAALKKEVVAPADLVLAAVGWLAREDKIVFSTSGRTVKISLS